MTIEFYDSQWHKRFSALQHETGDIFSALETSPDTMQRLYTEFVKSAYAKNISLLPSGLDTAALSVRNGKLTDLLLDIHAKETVSGVRELYTDKILESIAQNDMLIAASRGDGEYFAKQNEFIYNLPDKYVFAESCEWIRKEAEAALADSASTKLTKAAKEVLAILPPVSSRAVSLYPSKSTFETVRSQHFEPGGYFDTLFDQKIPSQRIIDREYGDEICNKILAQLNSGYSLDITTNGFWFYSPPRKKVFRPSSYSLTREAFIGIVAHEIGSHLLEVLNGQKQRLQLLSSGLDRYEATNEGRAILREQIVYSNFEDFIAMPAEQKLIEDYIAMLSWHNRIALHIAISLSVGIFDHKYSFAETYNSIFYLYFFWLSQASHSRAEQAAHYAAWLITTRITKGTDGNGGAYHKDMVYLEGNIRCWDVARRQPELILLGDLGKFDISNQKHVTILQELGILPVTKM